MRVSWGMRTVVCACGETWHGDLRTSPRTTCRQRLMAHCLCGVEMREVTSQSPWVQIRYFPAEGLVQKSLYSVEMVGRSFRGLLT